MKINLHDVSFSESAAKCSEELSKWVARIVAGEASDQDPPLVMAEKLPPDGNLLIHAEVRIRGGTMSITLVIPAKDWTLLGPHG